MIRDITIGQYFAGNSIIHKLDPRIKIVLTIAFIVDIFLVKNFWSLGLMLVSLLGITLISKIPVKTIFKSIKPLAAIVIFTSVLNIFYIQEGKVMFEFKFIKITQYGLVFALFMIVRIVTLVIASSLLTYTTTPTMLTDALERLLSPLKIFKIPVSTLAMMMTLALRFIPTLVEEVDKIMNAQKARGASFDTGGLLSRIKSLIPILIPLFVSSFRRAYELAFAMECRCYTGSDGRTKMKSTKISLRDILSVTVVVFFTAGIVLLNKFFAHTI